MTDTYSNPQSFKQAVTDRLRQIARANRDMQLQDLQRQFAYDRLLCRVFRDAPENWILKGATAMLARLQGIARHTTDIDLYCIAMNLDEAEAALRVCAAIDLKDWFRFELGSGHRLEPQGTVALRLPVASYIGATEFVSFHIDLVTDVQMTGLPETVSSLVNLDVPGLTRISYRVYPAVDHIADKVCALFETHVRASGVTDVSSRYRDLADIVVFARTANVDAAQLFNAISFEARRRHIELPEKFAVPASGDWAAGYSRVARDVPGLSERDIGAAVEGASRFLDPILADRARGHWDPGSLAWVG